jgi:tetratricopeptide (TPR) repeat protein
MTAGAPWRKRHPVLARSLLYGGGLALAAVAGLLLLRRGEQDREDRLDYLAKRLDGLGLVFLQDPSGNEVRKVLDEEYADPALPAHLRQRALRLRGIVEGRAKSKPKSEDAFEQACAIEVGPRERGACLVEWAEARTSNGDPAGAIALLAREDAVHDGPLGVLTAMSRAYAETERGRATEGATSLETALASLRRPLPSWRDDHVSTRSWSFAEAATEATAYLVRLTRTADARPWARLVQLASEDAPSLRRAAKGLAGQGHVEQARAALERAERLDPEGTAREAAADAALRALSDAASPTDKNP